MQIEVTTRGRLTRTKEAEIIVKMKLVPRGGANRAKARRLGEQLRKMPDLADHLKRVVVGSSSVTMYLRASFDLAHVLANLQHEKDDPDQLPLFGKLAI